MNGETDCLMVRLGRPSLRVVAGTDMEGGNGNAP